MSMKQMAHIKENIYPIKKADIEVPIKAYIRMAPRFRKKYFCKSLLSQIKIYCIFYCYLTSQESQKNGIIYLHALNYTLHEK